MNAFDTGMNRFIDAAHREPRLSREEEAELLERHRLQADRGAADRLVRAHLRDVVFLATRYRHYGVPVEELISEGNLGLLRALEKYEPSHGTRFGTYAIYWIRAYVITHVLRSWSLVRNRTGVLRTRLFFRLRRERARLESLHGAGEATHLLLAERMNMTPERLTRVLSRLDARDVSLDEPQSDDGAATLGDRLASPDDQESSLAAEEVRDQLERALGTALPELDRRERFIVESRWMAGREEELSLADIGRELGVSRERVRQLETRARTKLAKVLCEQHGATRDWLSAATAA